MSTGISVRSLLWIPGWLVGAGLLLVVGVLVGLNLPAAIAVAALVLLIGLTMREPATLPIIAMPAVIVAGRIGGAVDLSVSDFALFAGFWAALFLAPRPFTKPMRSLLWISAIYQVATLFTVIANPFMANTVEWFHAWLLVAGSLMVGWAVGSAGRAKIGVVLFLIACMVVAVITCYIALQQLAGGHLGPVYIHGDFGMHKNLIGSVMAFAILIVYSNPHWLRLPRWVLISVLVLCALALLASQARQAIVGLAVAAVIIMLRPDPDRKRSKLPLLAIIPAIYFVWSAASEQLDEDNPFNSANQRLEWYEDALTVWQESPWVGMGLRYWTADRTEFAFQPPNAEIEMLASAGIIGMIGFLVLFGASLVVLWRVDPRYGTLAFAAVLMRFVQGQFDLFWVSVQVSIPFLIAGVCLGAQAFAQRRQPIEESLPAAPEVSSGPGSTQQQSSQAELTPAAATAQVTGHQVLAPPASQTPARHEAAPR